MKTYLFLTAILCLIMMIFPVVPLIYTNNTQNNSSVPAMAEVSSQNIQTQQEDTIRVLKTSSENIIDVEIFDYVCGALAAEMPLTFHEQALKAQSVVCYTYALWIKQNADNAPNELCDVSDDSSSYQGFLTKEEMKEKWGDSYEENYEKIKQIVTSVLGQYISYDNQPIMAVYHSLSSGSTISAKDAWGDEIPYLQSVTAPGDKLSPDFCTTVKFTFEQFKSKLSKNEEITFDFSNQAISNIIKNDSEFIVSIDAYSKTVDSKFLRSALGLKSPFFFVSVSDNDITFNVYGSGHGVGMSQYSADYMARQGSDYTEILNHFYKSTVIVKS